MTNKVYVLSGTISFEFSEVVAVYQDQAKAESIALQLNTLKGKNRYSIIAGNQGEDNIASYDEFDVYEFEVE